MNFKKLITLPLIALSFNFASAKHDNQSDRLLERSSSILSLVQQNVYRLDDQTQLKVLGHLRAIEQLVKHGDHSHPTPPPPAALQSVRGDIEKTTFSFNVTDLSDLHTQCVAFVSQKLGTQPSVDEMNVSINFEQARTLTNPTAYWKSEAIICSQIENAARAAGISYKGSKLFYSGAIENNSFVFSGMNIAEVGTQCDEFVRRIGATSVDEISVSVNFGASRDITNSNSYWKSSFEICQQVLQQK